MSQTSYDFDAPVAFAGLIADLVRSYIRSARNEELAAIPFGIAVKKGTGDADVKLPAAATDEIAGIVAHSHAHDSFANGVAAGVEPKGSVNLLVSGLATVQVEQAVTAADPVFVRFANGIADNTKIQKGAFRKDADTNTAKLLKGARFLTSAAANGFAVVQFDALAQKAIDPIELACDHVQVTASATVKFHKAPRAMVIDSVEYINPTGLAEHADNHYDIAVKNGSTVVASRNTKTGEGGTLAADTFVALTNGALAARTVAAGDVLALALTKSGTQTLPIGKVIVHGRAL